jgi:glucose-6-phosphate isomerase
MSTTYTFFPSRPYLSEDHTAKKINAFKSIINNPRTQFFYTFNRSELFNTSKNLYEKNKDKKYFYHIGIGGSSLGPEMLVSALKKSSMQFTFINNIDPEEIHEQLNHLNHETLKDSLFYFVSKSGGTAETMAALAIITQRLETLGVSMSELKKYYIFATDPTKSELLNISKEWDIPTLEVPSDVGGRFCVLTPVGFLPAFFAGIDVSLLLKGAKDAQNDLLNENGAENELIALCDFLYDAKVKKHMDQTVFMPYSSKLRSLSFWFTQLWAESLGKKKNKKGEIINEGFTPIVAYGATDQHSQVQLFMEGPNDKVFIVIEVESFQTDFSLKSSLVSNNLSKLSSYKLSQLMKAEMEGTIKALRDNSRPIVHVKIGKNDEYHLAQLILMFESATALMGEYLMVDPFDQPGVEAGKIYAFEFLNQL